MQPLRTHAPCSSLPRLVTSNKVPLVPCMQDWRVSVVEAALQFLADCTCLSGSFLRKRFAREAAPVLQRLLVEGPAHRNIIAPGGALSCRKELCSGSTALLQHRV